MKSFLYKFVLPRHQEMQINKFSTIVLLFFTMSLNAQINRELVHRFIDLELRNYPQASLIDLYKNYFQDAFGPGHLLADMDMAKNYLIKELAQTDYHDTILCQALGIHRDFYRINLCLVKNGTIALDTLLNGMKESSVLARNPELSDWIIEWNQIVSLIQSYKPGIPNLQEDIQTINRNLDKGIIVSHHSQLFTEMYHPHYRIIHKSVIERWKFYMACPFFCDIVE
ncbi:MAG: hypothetical protein PHF61_00385 [Bacteroidales bacterium]|nr:hypothetical protein [Bacteroidales bacterium]